MKPNEIVTWALGSKQKDEDLVQEQTSPGVAAFDKLKTRLDSKPVKDQLAFYKSFSDKLQAMFMDETPSADSKFNKFIRDIKGSFMDMIGGDEEADDGALEIDDMEDEEESLFVELADQEDKVTETTEDDGDFETDEVEEATKKKKVIKSPYASKIARLKDKVDGLVWKKKNLNDYLKSQREKKKGLGRGDAAGKQRYEKEIANIQKKKISITKSLVAARGTLSAAREMNKKWKEEQKGKKG